MAGREESPSQSEIWFGLLPILISTIGRALAMIAVIAEIGRLLAIVVAWWCVGHDVRCRAVAHRVRRSSEFASSTLSVVRQRVALGFE